MMKQSSRRTGSDSPDHLPQSWCCSGFGWWMRCNRCSIFQSVCLQSRSHRKLDPMRCCGGYCRCRRLSPQPSSSFSQIATVDSPRNPVYPTKRHAFVFRSAEPYSMHARKEMDGFRVLKRGKPSRVSSTGADHRHLVESHTYGYEACCWDAGEQEKKNATAANDAIFVCMERERKPSV